LEASCPKAAKERIVPPDACRQGAQASAVRDAPEQVVQGGLERRAAMEISMAERRAALWPWDVQAREESHARRAAVDSSSVWEEISPKKQGAL
jgi:hypothetical protein